MGATAKVADFSNVKDRGEFAPRRVTEGDYAARITAVKDSESKKDGEFQYVFTIKLKKFSQNSYPYYCKLTENQLWKLRNLLIAAGMSVPKKRMKLDPNKVVGKEIGVTMQDKDEYEGKINGSEIAAVFPVSELADGSEDSVSDDDFDEESAPVVAGDDDEDDADSAEEPAEDKPKKGKKKKGKKKKGSEENDLEELDISDL